MVTFQQHQLPFFHDHSTVVPDHDNNGLSGDIKITDPHAVPRIVLQAYNFLQVDVDIVLQCVRAQNQGITGLQHNSS